MTDPSAADDGAARHEDDRAAGGDAATRVTKRGMLKGLGAAATGLTGLAGAVTSSAALRLGPHRHVGDWTEGGSASTMDIGVVNMSTQPSKAKKAREGFYDGLYRLYDDLDWFDGYRLTWHDPDRVYRGEADHEDIEAALDAVGLDSGRHYHVIYNGDLWFDDVDGSYHGTYGESAWNSDNRQVSGVSIATTELPGAHIYVRSFHQALHNYIVDSVALDITGLDTDPYDAKHALGTVKQVGERTPRTVMADRTPQKTMYGCRSDLREGDTPKYNILFSDCTKEALERSARRSRDWWGYF